MISYLALAGLFIFLTVFLYVINKSNLGNAFTSIITAIAMTAIIAFVSWNRDSEEQFFFEVSPYKKCKNKGFYGRPLSFDYTINDPSCC